MTSDAEEVLNLVIYGWPSIRKDKITLRHRDFLEVLNLVIYGWPSILYMK